jgi:predicted alpha/beta-fold hydrolase
VSVPLFGYKDLESYYKENSCVHVLDKVKVPALFINSKDDPIIDVKWLPVEQIKENNNMIMVLT